MQTNLAGKVAIVTGAGSGIGLAIVDQLLAEGADVIGADLEPSALEGMEGVTTVTADLSTTEGVRAAVDTALSVHGKIDVLVNNVGIFPYRESFISTSDDDWQRVMDINFYSMVRACREVLPHMIEQSAGSIVSIASECARQPDVFFVDYSVSKAAMVSLNKALANEFGPQGVRCNIVSPGPTRTPPWDAPGGFGDSLAAEYGLDKEKAIEHFATEVRKLPLGKLGRPDDVAAAVVFLASDLASQVTGSEYCVNGGSYVGA
ncbi:MAG: SDR family oxidoreductase [Nocardioidaceae bacterium]|nr:SDR family oxidoreductase [Nocardioidaceae bacterium]